jgi:hypothetical protein
MAAAGLPGPSEEEIMLKVLIAAAFVAVALPAAAEEICQSHPASEWISKEEMSAKAVAAGYEVKSVKEEDGCWEVKGFKDGRRVEAYFDPKTGELVKTK